MIRAAALAVLGTLCLIALGGLALALIGLVGRLLTP